MTPLITSQRKHNLALEPLDNIEAVQLLELWCNLAFSNSLTGVVWSDLLASLSSGCCLELEKVMSMHMLFTSECPVLSPGPLTSSTSALT